MPQLRPRLIQLLWIQSGLCVGPEDRIVYKTSPGFDIAVWEQFQALVTGGTVVVASGEVGRDPNLLASLIEEHQVTMAHFVPSALRAFLADRAAGECASLRHVVCAGETLPFGLQRSFFAVLGSTALHNTYGPTETTANTYWRCDPGQDRGPVPIGIPVWNKRVYVLDDKLTPTAQWTRAMVPAARCVRSISSRRLLLLLSHRLGACLGGGLVDSGACQVFEARAGWCRPGRPAGPAGLASCWWPGTPAPSRTSWRITRSLTLRLAARLTLADLPGQAARPLGRTQLGLVRCRGHTR